VSIQPHVVFPTGEQDKRELVRQALQAGVADMSDPLVKARVLSELGIDFVDEATISEIDRQRAEINEMIATGRFVPTDPHDRHQVHYRVCLSFLRSEYGQYLKSHNPDVYRFIEAHSKIHAFVAMGDYERAAAEMSKVGIREWIIEKAAYEDIKELTEAVLGLVRGPTPSSNGASAAGKPEGLRPIETITAPVAAPNEAAIGGGDLESLLGQMG
jgi:hypothetical protein